MATYKLTDTEESLANIEKLIEDIYSSTPIPSPWTTTGTIGTAKVWSQEYDQAAIDRRKKQEAKPKEEPSEEDYFCDDNGVK